MFPNALLMTSGKMQELNICLSSPDVENNFIDRRVFYALRIGLCSDVGFADGFFCVGRTLISCSESMKRNEA